MVLKPRPVLPNKRSMRVMTFRQLVVAVVAMMVAIPLLTAPAHAQFALKRTNRNPDNPTMYAELGFGSVAWPDRWIPLTVHITGGTKAFEGLLSVTYAQDERVGSQIVRPVAVTPGKTSMVHMLVNLPMGCSQVSVSLARPGGRPVSSTTFTGVPDAEKGEVSLPPVVGSSPIVLALGQVRDPALASVHSMVDTQEERHALGRVQPTIGVLDPVTLAPTWAALDSVLVAVTTGEASRGCDPRVLAAVREWVSSGGRLVILANGPGDGWRDWLAAPGTPLPVDVEGVQRTDMSEALAEALAWNPPKADAPPDLNNPYAQPATGTPATPAAPEPRVRDGLFSAAASMMHRPIVLTPAGAAAGWRARFPTGEGQSGFVAEGPLGMGWVVVVGFNPEQVSELARERATTRVWYSLLETALGDFRAREVMTTQNYGYMADAFTSGGHCVSNLTASMARNTVLDAISDVPAVGNGVFPILFAGIFVLAMLIGPIDALVLRSLKARHRSWLTALGWIGLASVAAYFAPNLGRSGNTRINRFTVVDAVQAAPEPTGPSPAWRTGVVGVFAGESAQKPFEGKLNGSWWRTLSSQPEYWWGRGENMTPRRSLTALQTLPDLNALSPAGDAWGGFVPDVRGAGGTQFGPVSFKLWTFATFQEHTRTTTSIGATVRRSDDESGGWNVEVAGVPAGARVVAAALRVAGEEAEAWYELSLAANGSMLTADVDGAGEAKPPKAWWLDTTNPQNQPYYSYGTARVDTLAPASLLLPGPDRRGWGVTQALKRGNAVVYLHLADMPPDVTIDVPVDETHVQVCRLVVPVSGQDGETGESAEKEREQ